MAKSKQTTKPATASERTGTASQKNGRAGKAAPRTRKQPAAAVPEMEVAQQSEELTRQVAGVRHEADEARQQVEDARQQAEGIHTEMQEFRVRAGELARELYQAEELARQERDRCEQLHNTVGDIEEQFRHSRQQLNEATQNFVTASGQQVDEIRQSLRAAQAEAEQIQEEFRGLRATARQHAHGDEEAQRELDGLRQRVQEVEHELAELAKRSAAARTQADFLDEETRVTHRMLRHTRDELRRTGEVLPAIPEMPGAHLEAAPAEEPLGNEAGSVVTATVAAGSPGERLIRYLNDAWSVETTLLDTLNKMAQEVIDPQVKEFFAAHRETTARQRDALGARLRELGREPSGGKGFFHRLVGGIWEGLHRPGDDIDRTVQDLMKGYATEHFEVAMYQALVACASAASDSVTAELARRHQQEEREAAERVWTFIAPTVALTAQPAG